MATSITDQADVLTYGLVTDNEIHSLSTDRMKKDNWATLHARAWTKVLDYMLARATSIEESDMTADDVTALIPATVYMVLHYAYAQAEFMNDENQKRSALYWDRSIKEIQEVRSPDDTWTRGSFDFRRARRM